MNMKEILIKVYLMGCSKSTRAKILRIVHSKADVEKLSGLIAQQSGRRKTIGVDSPLRNGRGDTRGDSGDGDSGDKGRYPRVKTSLDALISII